MAVFGDVYCPLCGYKVDVEYDIWDNSFWRCYNCGLRSHQLVTYSNNTTAPSCDASTVTAKDVPCSHTH